MSLQKTTCSLVCGVHGREKTSVSLEKLVVQAHGFPKTNFFLGNRSLFKKTIFFLGKCVFLRKPNLSLVKQKNICLGATIVTQKVGVVFLVVLVFWILVLGQDPGIPGFPN